MWTRVMDNPSKTISAQDNIRVELPKKDISGVRIKFKLASLVAAVDPPTELSAITLAEEIAIRDGIDLNQAVKISFDGNELDTVKRALQMIYKEFSYSWHTLSVGPIVEAMEDTSETQVDMAAATGGETRVVLPIRAALSKFKNKAYLDIQLRDPTDHFGFATEPSALTVQLEVDIRVDTIDHETYLCRMETDPRTEYTVEMPEKIAVQAVGMINTAGYAGGVSRVRFKDGTIVQEWDNDDELGDIEKYEARCVQKLSPDVRMIKLSGEARDVRSSLFYKITVQDDPTLIVAGIASLVKNTTGPNPGERSTGVFDLNAPLPETARQVSG